jgi:pyridoxal phosphate enzyme (YggS family)
MTIRESYAAVRARVDAAALRAGRDPASVRIVGASAAFKGVSAEMMREALDAGLRDFGENRVQEAEAHIAALGERASEATWHLIGHLQANKTRDAARLFDTIQSVDSVRVAERLNSAGERRLGVMIEVNVAAEPTKAGVAPSEVAGLVSAIAKMPSLDLLGLMTIAPAVPDAEFVRPVFRELRELAQAQGLAEVSMGMTNDFEVAIEEGATIVRIGRAIFGGSSS